VDAHFAISFEAAGEVLKPSSQTAPCRKTAAKKGARKRGQKAGDDREAPAARAHAAPTAFLADQRFPAVFERILHTRHFQAWPDLDDVRGRAACIATLANWSTNAFSAFVFPWYVASFGIYTGFFTCAAICLVPTVFFRAKVPETKGRNLEEIEKYWQP